MGTEMKTPKVLLGFHASAELAERIRAAAAKDRRSVADWLRLTVEAALATEKKGLKK